MYKKTVLDNGVRLVSEKMPGVRSVAMGLWVGTGSKLEEDDEAGVSHMIEHLLFKGTKKRSARDIAESLESLGGQLNAFTSKEYTCYYARVLDEHFPLAVDVLSDMFFSSLFREQDIEKEKKVIQEEIRMYEDTPDEIVHDLFSQTVWHGHPLGRPVIGTRQSVAGLDQEKILNYYHCHYQPDNLVIALAGNVEHEQALELLAPIFGASSGSGKKRDLTAPQARAEIKCFHRQLEQAQICLGVPALSQYDERLYSLQVLSNVLGGGASSRLFQRVREERGLAYSVYTYYTAFQNAGLFTIYAGTNPENVPEMLEVVGQELSEVVTKGITEEELNRTKEQFKGSLLLASESVIHRMHRLGKSELSFNRHVTPEEIVDKITAVTREDVRTLAEELLKPSAYTLVVIGDVDAGRITPRWLGSLPV